MRGTCASFTPHSPRCTAAGNSEETYAAATEAVGLYRLKENLAALSELRERNEQLQV